MRGIRLLLFRRDGIFENLYWRTGKGFFSSTKKGLSMHNHIQQCAAAIGSGVAIAAGAICDPVNVETVVQAVTLNHVSLGFGCSAGLLTTVIQAIKLYRYFKDGKGPN